MQQASSESTQNALATDSKGRIGKASAAQEDDPALLLVPPGLTASERAQIVRICLRVTHDRDAAEDLAQETLLEAWRHWHKLRDPHDPQARARWLAAIAGHICRRWARTIGRDQAHMTHLPPRSHPVDGEPEDGFELLAAESDGIDAELEQAERSQLLDRAMGLLPPDMREALIARYLLETPLAEIARRQGLSEATLSVRLHRGRQALRHHLATTLREEALAYGLAPITVDDWQETRIWCPICGGTRLLGQLGGTPVHLRLRCPQCGNAHAHFMAHESFLGLLDGIQTFKAALNRVMAWADPYYRSGAISREVVCRCGRTAPLLQMPPTEAYLSPQSEHGLCAICSCPSVNRTDIAGMALFTPEGRRFWREHPRIRLGQPWHVETGGREAIVMGYESVSGSARLDTLFARDTFELLAIHEMPGA